jgi:hypothetical protein
MSSERSYLNAVLRDPDTMSVTDTEQGSSTHTVSTGTGGQEQADTIKDRRAPAGMNRRALRFD